MLATHQVCTAICYPWRLKLLAAASTVGVAGKMVSIGSHSWESLPQPQHAWEEELSGEDPDPESDPQAASMMFLDVCLAMYMASAMSAKNLCVLCYWASKAGMATVSEYGLQPDRPTGHYQRHLDSLLGFAEAKKTSYTLSAPGQKRGELSRSTIELPTRPPHELAQEELERNPTVLTRLLEARRSSDLPETYDTHPVVRGTTDLVVPWGLYMDGVSYSLTDSVLGCWLINLVSGARSLICVIRKRLVCQCGCRGWCTYDVLMRWLHWSFKAMAEGVFPTARHDGSAWLEADESRRARAGQPMKMRGALLRIKGDWEEFCVRLGFPTWASGIRPCFCCAASGPDLADVRGVSVVGLPWHVNSDPDYDAACSRCERWAVITPELRHVVLRHLHYDKRPSGSKGRSLRQAIASLGLRPGDRLEPNASLPDVADFEGLALPARVLFWRPEEEPVCQHRCPLFDASIGITPNRSIA